MRARTLSPLLLTTLVLVLSGCGMFSDDCPRTVRFVLTDSATSQVTVHDECAVGPERLQVDCRDDRWELTGPDGKEGSPTTFVRFTVDPLERCGRGFSGRDGIGRLYSGTRLRDWDQGFGPFASGTWNRISGGQATTGSFMFYEKTELAP